MISPTHSTATFGRRQNSLREHCSDVERFPPKSRLSNAIPGRESFELVGCESEGEKKMKYRLMLAVLIFSIVSHPVAGQVCTVIDNPTAEYFGPMADPSNIPDDALAARFGLGTEKCSLGTPGSNSTICRDSDNNVEARFSNALMVRQVPTTWASWSSPPNSESPTPIVGWNTTTTLTVTLADGYLAGIAGMEIEPQQFAVHTITAVFKNLAGVALLTITRSVDGTGGARLFATSCEEELINRIDISTDDPTGFAIAKFRADSFVINRDVPPATPLAPAPTSPKSNADPGKPENQLGIGSTQQKPNLEGRATRIESERTGGYDANESNGKA